VRVSALVAAALVAALLGCSRGNVYVATGEVREVDRANKQIVIAHDDIPGLMSAMTMGFDVADPELLDRTAPGQRIEFDLQVTKTLFRITAIRAEGVRAGAVRHPTHASLASESEPAPDFSLTDQDGKTVSLADLRGHVLLVDFIFTRCAGPCPILTARQVELQRSLPPDVTPHVRFVSISLDPEYDTPEILGEYARARGADLSTWSFLTGPADEVADVVKRWGVGTLRTPDGTLDHAVATFLVDPNGRIARRWLGLEAPVGEMRAQVTALAESESAAQPPAGG
jgi:protein SCO1/2